MGEIRWEAKCLVTGAHEYPEGCRDIDGCLVTPTCRPQNTCVDGSVIKLAAAHLAAILCPPTKVRFVWRSTSTMPGGRQLRASQELR